MKTNLILAALMALGITAFAVVGCNKSEDGPAHQYTCPMHPEVVKDAAGNCPKCGMKLVEKK